MAERGQKFEPALNCALSALYFPSVIQEKPTLAEMQGAPTPHKRDLSQERRALVELFQSIGFGRVEQLRIRDRQPILDPPPRVIQTVKFGAKNGSRPELTSEDFALKQQLVELFERLDVMKDGVIPRIEVAGGLPLLMEIERVAQNGGVS